jgi:hypothetical protein
MSGHTVWSMCGLTLTLKDIRNYLGKVWNLAGAVATLLVLLEALTNPPQILTVLLSVVGEYASRIYDALVLCLLILFGLFCIRVGVQYGNAPPISKLLGVKTKQEPKATQPASPIQIQSGGIVTPRGGEPLIVTVVGSGLEVYTRAEVEEKFPFERFVSRAKRGGELVFVAVTFAMGRGKTDTIKRLIRERNVTVSFLLLAPFSSSGLGTAKIESDFEWEGLTAEIQQTLIVLCRLRMELGELKDHLTIRTYDRAPTLSLIAIDPNSEDAVMQVGNYLAGTDASARFQIMISKKTRKDLFVRYWDEYHLIRESSQVLDYKAIEREFLS